MFKNPFSKETVPQPDPEKEERELKEAQRLIRDPDAKDLPESVLGILWKSGWCGDVCSNLHKFKDLSSNTAEFLIQRGELFRFKPEKFFDNLDRFVGVDVTSLTRIAMEHGHIKYVIDNSERLGVNMNEIISQEVSEKNFDFLYDLEMYKAEVSHLVNPEVWANVEKMLRENDGEWRKAGYAKRPTKFKKSEESFW